MLCHAESLPPSEPPPVPLSFTDRVLEIDLVQIKLNALRSKSRALPPSTRCRVQEKSRQDSDAAQRDDHPTVTAVCHGNRRKKHRVGQNGKRLHLHENRVREEHLAVASTIDQDSRGEHLSLLMGFPNIIDPFIS